MSHVTTIDVSFSNDEEGLEEAKLCAEILGGEFVRGKKTYAWYGRHVGDYPLPKGFKVSDMGKCEHVIRFKGVNYEIGLAVSKTDSTRLVPMFDFWRGGGLDKIVGGEKALTLKGAMAQAVAGRMAKRKGQHVEVVKKPDGGVRLVLVDNKDKAKNPMGFRSLMKKLIA